METKVVSFSKKGEELHRVVVGEETGLMRMRRSLRKAEQAGINDADQDAAILRVVLYPDCVASVVDWGTFAGPISYEEFADLPGKFVDDWATATWDLNPDWQVQVPQTEKEKVAEAEEIEKKLSS